ncbi:hypothetical protein ACJIZ3_018875 [Penstemon smallii]|uniref:Nucleolar pre-ribosomal-associated protein 1 n=1 Tax=Penstemon smallii TaxID=265156 RepID=A0ABD3T109_9LAMI
MEYKLNDESKIKDLFRNLPSVELHLFTDASLPESTNKFHNEELTNKFNNEAKLKELLRNIASVELQLCSDASKEFIKVLKSDKGSEFVRAYLQTSSNLVEISQAWEFRKGKPGFSHILNLISAILKHCNNSNVGDDDGGGGVKYCELLDKFAWGLIEEEKMRDLYKELKSKEGKRQNAVLLLLASIVRRNSQLAWEVAKTFDFKLSFFPKLAEVRLRAKFGEGKRKSLSTRKAFVGFAMAFLEAGTPRLLRGVLQQKEMYSGVLRGLGNDDEETVIYILSVLRDRVLVPESLVPPGLRSVLFGSVTLEKLVGISGRDDFGDAAELAHNVLVMVCTNPVNGLMPDMERQPTPLRGNRKRLLDLMKKLKATEVEYHKDLLMAVVKGRPFLASEFLDEFPYNLEDIASANWFAAISLAADVVSSVRDGLSFGFVDKPPAYDSPYLQNIFKCIVPRPFTRLVINKGLLHSDSLVKHGTLRLVLEALKLLDSLMNSVNSFAHSNNQNDWAALKAEIQNGVRMLLPDPQVLLSLLSPLDSHFTSLESTTKRKAETEYVSEHNASVHKRLKSSTSNEDMDIVVVGVDSFSEVDFSGKEVADSGGEQQSENGADTLKILGDLWGLGPCSMKHMYLRDGDTYFYSKLLDTLMIFNRTMPMAFEGFDFFKLLPNNPLSLPTMLLQSLLYLLNEHVNQFSGDATLIRTQPQIYKHLHPVIQLLLYSPVKEIKDQAFILAKAAMLSSGAFDNNPRDICAWFFFIPGYSGDHVCVEDLEVEIFQNLSSLVVSFLCDAVATTGNNLYKYMGFLRHYIYDSEGGKGRSPDVSPFIICVLEKCLRLLNSDSGSFKLPQKSLISLYVCNTIKYVLDTQVNAGPLSLLIDRVLTEKLENFSSKVNSLEPCKCPCEWRPLKTLLHFSRNLLYQQCYSIYSSVEEVTQSSNSFFNTMRDIKEVLRSEYEVGLVGLTMGFSFSLMCTRPSELLHSFPLILSISNNLLKVPFSVLASIFFLESSFLTDVSKLWPEIFYSGLESVIHGKEKEVIDKENLDSEEAASAAFAFYLKRAPFCVLFSSIVQSNTLHLFEQSTLQTLLLDKLTEMPFDHLVSSLCHVLFWINHARSSYRVGSVDEVEMLSEMCFILAEHLLKQLLVENVNIVNPAHVRAPLPPQYAVEVAEIILNHPVVTATLNQPISGKEFSDSVFKGTLETSLAPVKEGIHRMDHHILNLLRSVFELLFPMCNGQSSEQAINGITQISRAFKALSQKLFQVFKNKFDGCIQSLDFKPLVPTFYAVHTLIRFISPFELLELVDFLFSRIDFIDTSLDLQSRENSLFVCLHLAGCTFDILSEYIWQPNSESYCIYGTDETHFDVSLFERIFSQVFEIATRLKLDVANICLLKAVNVVKLHKVIQQTYLPSIMVLSRVVASIPVNVLSHCLNGVNRTKAELLYLIAETSPLHLSVIGYMFSEMLNKSILPKANLTEETSAHSFTDEELVMLLPTVFLYLKSVISKSGGERSKSFKCILLVYGQMLLNGFSSWEIFVSRNIFEIGLHEMLPASTEELLNLFSDSILGKAIIVARDHLALSDDLMKSEKRLNLFNSVCPYTSDSDGLFDYDCGETELYLLSESLEFVNRIVAKTNFCRMLLFPHYNHFNGQLVDNEDRKLITLEVDSEIEKSRIQFLRMLINSWIFTIKKFPMNLDHSGNIEPHNLSVYRFLEIFMLSNILDLTTEIHGCLIKLSSLPFLEQLVKSFLLYRFGDGLTLKMLRTVLTCLSDGNFSCASVMQLLLAHSQFPKLVQFGSKSHDSTQLGLVFTPMQSILKSFVIPHTHLNTSDCKNDTLICRRHIDLLELVKFVRVLFRVYAQQKGDNCGEDIDIRPRELVHLLLSSYGATCAEVDMEIYDLIHEIESYDKSSAGTVAQLDYLWGVASLNVKKDWEHDKDFEEHRKVQFRANLPVDPKLCAQTVLYFPYFKFVSEGTKLQKDNSTVVQQASCTTADKMQIYDPVFILRFSIHCLSMSYIEPIEFASLGLLAIAFVSLSSPDDDMRNLGDEVLAKFKTALKKCQKKKDVRQLLRLLSYLQRPSQRIPSIITVFAAEASLVLLDPSHENYSAISKYLKNSPKVNMNAIPLFQFFFWSSSVSFRADRLWMLRLLYVGLNTEDDAQIYIRNSVFEILMSFYSSPLSDNCSKELIIQIVKKAVHLHKVVRFLVEHCGLILWLSSVVSSLLGSECQDRKMLILTLLPKVLEVVNDITMPRNFVEWLPKHAMEQLSELSSHFFKLLVSGVIGVELIKEQNFVCNSILQILTLVLKMSQKNKICQPHFTLSDEGLFQLYEVVDVCSKTRCNATMVLGLKAILMSSPPINILRMDQEKLLKFLRWAVTTAIQSESTEELQPEDSDYNLLAVSGKNSPEDSLVSKLLRWLTASVIRGKLSCKISKLKPGSFSERPSLHTLQSLLEFHEEGFGEYAGYDILAVPIIYLLQLLGFSHGFLPSVVSALCLLLLSSSSESEFLVGPGSSLPLLSSKIRCPAEANPAWRWSFYEPWRDISMEELNEVEKLDEIHACERLLIVASNIIVKKSIGSKFFTLKDADNLHVYDWEKRSMIQSD